MAKNGMIQWNTCHSEPSEESNSEKLFCLYTNE